MTLHKKTPLQQPRALPTVWYSGIEDKEGFAQQLLGSRDVTDQLCKIIEYQIELLERQQLQDEFYNNADLTNKLCYLNGKLAAYRYVLGLFRFNDVKE